MDHNPDKINFYKSQVTLVHQKQVKSNYRILNGGKYFLIVSEKEGLAKN